MASCSAALADCATCVVALLAESRICTPDSKEGLVAGEAAPDGCATACYCLPC